jgi:CubicO group peptidase (beta-lactamase class C family)
MKLSKLPLWAVAALAIACGSSTPKPPPPAVDPIPASRDPALAQRVDAAIDKAITDQKLVGVVVMIARDGKLVYSRAAGLIDREAGTATREDTVFRLASMSKPVTSVAALALVDQGKLSLDDPVTKWLPEFRPRLPDGAREAVITVRQLITHTSGLTYKFLQPPDGSYHRAAVSDGLAEPGLPASTNLRRLASVPLVHVPGTAWNYSLSTDVLGEVVAKAGGGTLPEVLQRVVTGPLGMTDTAFTVTDRERVAWPYAASESGPPARMTEPYDWSMQGASVKFSPARLFDPGSFPSGGAGLAGTARDYLRFAEALRTGGAPILKPETARALRESQVGKLEVPFAGPGGTFGFGFGITVDPAAAKSPVGAGTFYWAGIYGTGFWIDPPGKLSVVVLTNVAGNMFQDELQKAIYATGS